VFPVSVDSVVFLAGVLVAEADVVPAAAGPATVFFGVSEVLAAADGSPAGFDIGDGSRSCAALGSGSFNLVVSVATDFA